MSLQEFRKTPITPDMRAKIRQMDLNHAIESSRRASFRAKLFESIESLRKGEIAQKDFFEGLMKEGDGKRVHLVVKIGGRIEAEDHTAILARTGDGKLVIDMAPQYLRSTPTITVQVGLNEEGQLTVEKAKAQSKKELGEKALQAFIDHVIIPKESTKGLVDGAG